MTIYLDISILEKGRMHTGIQRVVKEFLSRAILLKNLNFHILCYDIKQNLFYKLDSKEVKEFLHNIKEFQFTKKVAIDITNIKSNKIKAFFDIDSMWNADLKREILYPMLKQNDFLVFNYIYDLVPIVMPEVSHFSIRKNFKSYFDSICLYSDMVFCDSASARDDFLNYNSKFKPKREIPTRVTGLGSDFSKSLIKKDLDEDKKKLLKQKYILFVGTIEPRKNQSDVLDAFEDLSTKYPALNLIFIGKKGWNVDAFIKKIKQHKLKDKKLFWFDDIDDTSLELFYQNAFIVTYLSKYEGYGLPISESLNYNNITIASKNSSLYEVGRDFVDYVTYGSKNELIDIISLYLENNILYALKKKYIKEKYKRLTWDRFADSILDVFSNYEKSMLLKNIHQTNFQFVFISIDFHNLQGTIKQIDKYINFQKEYIVVTSPKFLSKFKNLKTQKKLTIIDETDILKKYAIDFHKKDHQSKNWLLRASLLNIDFLDEEFIMLDDDNRPLKKIEKDFFINQKGAYNAYFFHNLLNWHHNGTEYDHGQQNTKQILSEKNYELLSYSSHIPQIINKSIFKEVVDEFFQIGLDAPIDEWSTYFNYANAYYPMIFNKKVFETLNWPANHFQWEFPYPQKEFSFENYYKELYENGVFKEHYTYEQKLEIKKTELKPLTNTKNMFLQNTKILKSNNLVHGICSFKADNIEFYLSNIPYFCVVGQNSVLRLPLNFKLINHHEKNLDISLVIFLNGGYRTLRKLTNLNCDIYQESIIEFPIFTKNLQNGMYNITFNLIIDNHYIYTKNSPYLMKLIVSDTNIDKIEAQTLQAKQSLKDRIKSMPYIGWLSRWTYNLLRLNNIKYISFKNKKQLELLTKRVNRQQQYIDKLQQQVNTDKAHVQTLLRHNHQHHLSYKNIEKTIKSQINKQLSSYAINFDKRIEDAVDKVEKALQASPQKEPKLLEIKNEAFNFMLDDYYLHFENLFRGEREVILKRYEKYLKYLNPSIKTALDIGCGRGEWVELLQNNYIDAQGVDLNSAMLSVGKVNGAKNLSHQDAFEFFEQCKDNSFDLITSFHIIEHIPYEKLFIFMTEVSRIAAPNATIMLETPNPQNLQVSSYEFYKDPTHLNPLPAPLIKFMLEYLNFKDVTIHYLNPDSVPNKAQDYLVTAKVFKDIEIVHKHNAGKPKLAYITPLPPARTGIASYSKDLLPYLTKYYDIEVIVSQDDVENIDNFQLRSPSWLKNNHKYYDRVLYHIGNSKFHDYMPELLEQTRGVVLLHDFFLSNLVAQTTFFNRDYMYAQHGYKILYEHQKYDNLTDILWKYPLNKEVLNNAINILVHSDYSKQLSNQWFSKNTPDDWIKINHLRVPRSDETLLSKKELNLPEDSFVVCSFGVISKHKRANELLEAWIKSSLYKKQNTFLLFVGRLDGSQYSKDFEKTLQNLGQNNIFIIGWCDDYQFKSYLKLADIAVQLRGLSRGETSGVVLDAMNFNTPLIINANGSMAEFPKDILCMLKDNFSTDELCEALDLLYSSEKIRTKLKSEAKKYLSLHHDPQNIAKAYYEAIEKSYALQNSQEIDIHDISLIDTSKARQKQILVDISSIVRDDLKTGIQRVVKSQIIELIKNASDDCRVEPVYLNIEEKVFYYAREYTLNLLNIKNAKLTDEQVTLSKHDLFYGLDLCVNEVDKGITFGIFESYKKLGVKIVFLVYDLLPILKPQFFPQGSKNIHQKWLKNITHISDEIICISKNVQYELLSWMEDNSCVVPTSYVHLGSDIKTYLIQEDTKSFSIPNKNITFLAVGTIEPRKGYVQLLQAFELLWEEGISANLFIVGKKGWMNDTLTKKIETHHQYNTQLFWFKNLNDINLKQAYDLADALILPSEAEGFGLPLVEAAKHNLPIIARNIPIFKEIAKEYAYYFENSNSSSVLYDSLKKWLALYGADTHPKPDDMPYLTWQDNAKKVLKMLS